MSWYKDALNKRMENNRIHEHKINMIQFVQT